MSRRARRQAWWLLEVVVTITAGFTAAVLAAVALERDGWSARVAPVAGAGVALLLVALLVLTRARRWRAGRVS